MKILFIIGFISIATAAIIPFEGLRQQNDTTDVINEPEQNLDTTILNDEGYKYKSVKRLKYRQRRDITEVVNEYLPAAEDVITEIPEVKEGLNDVSQISIEYLPTAEKTSTEIAADVKSVNDSEGSANSAVLGENGYEYKTVRRLKYRQRRDVSEIDNEYLPPAEETSTEVIADVKSVDDTEGSADSAVLGENGYGYKTVRRLKYRQRRDVSEIDNEYLPPAEETSTEVIADVKSIEETEGSADSAVLGENCYEYKTVRRLKYRQRRDVSEFVNEYLPPDEETSTEVIADVKSVDETAGSNDLAVLGENGYEYKTVRRLKYRQRRDVSEIANEYLPPAEETSTETVSDVKSVDGTEGLDDSAVLGENGYKYKAVRRLKYRQRRDVSEIANEYLPPAEETSTETAADVKSVDGTEGLDDSAVLGENGNEYKAVRRLKYRQRRDVSEIANEYLPPAEETSSETVADVKSVDETEGSAGSDVLGDNGYEYKTVRRLKYRQRRDVSEIANDYLPPSEESSTETAADVKSVDETADSDDSAVLGENGYEYKTVHRLKYRQRRDVSEIANEYLPPAEETSTAIAADVKSVDETEGSADSAILGENGYVYKTVRRLKYRQRRDVSEIANEYLPPLEETSTEIAADVKSVGDTKGSADSAVLGENGYEYKTVRRLKYRQRRDVSEIANEYLPPFEETSTETVADVKSVDETEGSTDSAVLGENGYEYKTVRRLKYRQRRDVSEIANEYLPTAEESSTEISAEVKSSDDSHESASLGDNGYEYKTVLRLKHRL